MEGLGPLHPRGQLTRCFSAVAELLVYCYFGPQVYVAIATTRMKPAAAAATTKTTTTTTTTTATTTVTVYRPRYSKTTAWIRTW